MFRRFVLLALGIAIVACTLGIAMPRRSGAGLAVAGESRSASSAPEARSGGGADGVVGMNRSLRLASLSPGWSQTETYVVENPGETSLHLIVTGANFVDRGGSFTTAEAAVDPANSGDLGTHVRVTVTTDGAKAYDGSLEGLVAWGSTDLGIVAPGHAATVRLRFSVDSWTGAEIQGDESAFELGFALRRPSIARADNVLDTE